MEALKKCISEILHKDLETMNISGPRKKEGMKRYDLRPVLLRGRLMFQLEGFDGSQVFHENLAREEVMARLAQILPAYRNVRIVTQEEEITGLISKKGKVTIRKKKRTDSKGDIQPKIRYDHNRPKRYILPEGTPVPFLIDLGVMNPEGKIVGKKYDKFRQINRFLEFIEDILPALQDRAAQSREITILDFGCGKSYLTFAMYYYLHILKKQNIRIIGLDRKKKVIRDCQALARKYGYDKLTFMEGNIEDYEGLSRVDMVVTLHACDTATDYALAKAVFWGARVILSVPCCQHELNKQYKGKGKDPFAAVSDYGILKDRFCALATDGIRAKMLESMGYRTQILEFIDMEHTPKNLLIRATLTEDPFRGDKSSNDPESKKGHKDTPEEAKRKKAAREEAMEMCHQFGFRPSIIRLLEEGEGE